MNHRATTLIGCLMLLLAATAPTLAATASTLAATAPTLADESELARGQYLVDLLGCGRCHTEGYLVGNEAHGPYLAGSQVGIAYTAYSEDDTNPGIVFPSNLTSDDYTGLGTWSEQEVVMAMTTGIAKGGHERLIVMPWPNYNALTDSDLASVAKFLKALPAVSNPIPAAIPEGGEIDQPYIRFGVYQFYPHRPAEPAE